MKELKSILKTYRVNLEAKKWMALVTVLQVQGSSYRQPGARMLITEDGEIVGSVSGGCLERNLIQQAQVAWANPTRSNEVRVLQYDTTEEGDDYEALKSVSLACQGIIDIGVEILREGVPHPFLEQLGRSLKARESYRSATLISGTELSFVPGSRFTELPKLVSDALSKISKTSVQNFQLPEGRVSVLLEKIDPPKHWVVFGASHDSVPLAELGRFLGWHVTVVNCQSSYTMPERFFSEVDQVIKCAPSEILDKVDLSPGTLCALVTHNYFHDLEILKQLLKTEVAYIGLLGPRKKGLTILEDLRLAVPDLNERHLLRLHSPAGVDTGAEDPFGVALSIITEALATTSGRKGGFLKDREGPIHARESL